MSFREFIAESRLTKMMAVKQEKMLDQNPVQFHSFKSKEAIKALEDMFKYKGLSIYS